MQQDIPINPSLLQWAREEAGLSVEEAAQRARIQPLKGGGRRQAQSPGERLRAWENGQGAPSWRQLEEFARAYRRPTLTFFLPAPPVRESKLRDFRIKQESPRLKDSPEFAAFKRRVELLHDTLVFIAQSQGAEPVPFVASATVQTPVDELAGTMRNALGFGPDDHHDAKNGGELLGLLRSRMEEKGVFVLIEGDLGSHHSRIEAEEFRGVAISHPLVPLIVVNQYDAPAARLFTLMHEFTHLWTGDTGVSNYPYWSHSLQNPTHKRLEDYCNAVAAEFLAPKGAVIAAWPGAKGESLLDRVSSLARIFKVSRLVMARRLRDVGLAPQDEYWSVVTALQTEWKKSRARQKEKPGGPPPGIRNAFRLGRRLASTLVGAANEGLVSYQEASRLLRVNVNQFDELS